MWVVNDDPRAWGQRRNETSQDADAVLVWPVMEYCSEVIHIGTFDWLRREEIMHHELDTIVELRWKLISSCSDRVIEILDSEREVGKMLCERPAS